MLLRVGTSGFSYKEWKGTFYPEDLPQAKMLAYYAERFATVEINNTFYRMPKEETLAGWRDQVPSKFRFVLKAPQRITHQKKLAGADDEVARLFQVAGALGDRLGPVLFQLPPYLRADPERLRAFLGTIPAGHPVAFEFRHPSWGEEQAGAVLRKAEAALCIADTDEAPVYELPRPTAEWGYIRLRRADYPDQALSEWCARIAAQPWNEAWVFFKHEDEGKGPAYAARFVEAAERSGLALA
ncbi:MAG TPA: DUF72 domain-containing protein [Thermoanaerobaculia bacterium]|nr:DUF72 domain-containing protein [Thermoanaerobaculia bacterium]